MIARAIRRGDAEARLVAALTTDARAAGVTLTMGACRSCPWSSATFEGTQLQLDVHAGPESATRAWVAALADAELPMRGHVAMPPALDAAVAEGDGLRVTLTVLVLIDA